MQHSKKLPKSRHLGTITQICRAIYSQLRHLSTTEKNLLSSNISPSCLHNVVNFGSLAAEICWRVWGTPANFNGFRVLAALLHGILAVVVRQTLRRWTEGATYIRQGGHHVGHCPHSSWRYLRPVFSASRVQQVSDLHSKFTLGPHHVWKNGRHPICDRWD